MKWEQEVLRATRPLNREERLQVHTAQLLQRMARLQRLYRRLWIALAGVLVTVALIAGGAVLATGRGL